jgi:hypothetical protein
MIRPELQIVTLAIYFANSGGIGIIPSVYYSAGKSFWFAE